MTKQFIDPATRSLGREELVVQCGTCQAPITTRPYGVSISADDVEAAARWHRRAACCPCLDWWVTTWESIDARETVR